VPLLARRYELLGLLGSGSFGEVREALDTITGERVAVKLFRGVDASEVSRIRREIGTLRRLRVPGVVRLLDEGADGDTAFLVMERVVGRAFPGRARPVSWAALAGPAVALLETVARIHDAGVVHRDLKPDNVLVGETGRVTVLDFGIARGALAGRRPTPAALEGTPAYLSPEQVMGEPVTALSDLFTVGVMLYEALAGAVPFLGDGLHGTLLARLTMTPPPLGLRCPDAPAAVVELVTAMLARLPDARPRSARDVAAALHDARAPLRPSLAPSPLLTRAAGSLWREEELRAFVAGHERVFHLPTDVARLLFERSGGAAGPVAAELDAWVRAGLAEWSSGRVVVPRDALERLRDQEHTVSLPAEPARLAEAFVDRSLRRAAVGRHGAAIEALDEALDELRAHAEGADVTAEVARVLEAWLCLAIDAATPAELDRFLYELHRGDLPPRAVEPLDTLARAALALHADLPRAGELAASVRFDAAPLELRRHGVRVQAARSGSLEAEEALLAELEGAVAASPDPAARAAHAVWLARLRYRQGRFLEAAGLHEAAADVDPTVPGRVAALRGAASARMEAFDFDGALRLAERARSLAAAHRLAHLEARAEWMVRCVRYRRGDALAPDPELLDAIGALGVAELEGLALSLEAAVAWRAGDLARARALAGRARLVWLGTGRGDNARLMRCFLSALGDALEGDELAAMRRWAAACEVPGFGVQALGLVGAGVTGAAFEAMLGPLAAQVPERHHGARLDVLSVREALARARGV